MGNGGTRAAGRIEGGEGISKRAIFNNVVVCAVEYTWTWYVVCEYGGASYVAFQFTFAPLSRKPFQVLTGDVGPSSIIFHLPPLPRSPFSSFLSSAFETDEIG